MAVGRQGLENFKKRSSTENDEANENRASRIGETEKRADDEKCNDVLKVSKGLHLRPHQERRQLIVDSVNGNRHEFVWRMQ